MTSRDLKRLCRIASGAEVPSIFWYFTDRKLRRAGFVNRFYTGRDNQARLGITQEVRIAILRAKEAIE